MFENLVEVLKANPRKIVYTEGTDARILESAARLKQGGFLTPILVGNVEDVKAAAKAGNFDIEGLEIIDPANYDKMDEMAQCMFDLRKGKMTMEEVRANLQKGNYFGTMLVKMGVADALLGAIRGGDIGKLFPDTDPAYEGADSLKLLAAVANLVREQGFSIVDIACVIAAQAPKLSPYRDMMRENLATAWGIAVENLGVKATTTEHLGFEGREEGISAQAVALVCRCK